MLLYNLKELIASRKKNTNYRYSYSDLYKKIIFIDKLINNKYLIFLVCLVVNLFYMDIVMEEKKIEQFNFTGKGLDYFKIWIINTVLIILTCGIYYAWAKVRKTQYFMQNSWFQGSHFNYHANPIAILKGNIFVLIFY